MLKQHCEVELNEETGEGYILIRDEMTYAQVRATLTGLAERGWNEVDPDEAVEPHEFADGGLGVKSYLYQDQEGQEVADGVAAAGR